jgi:hypothetical protein
MRNIRPFVRILAVVLNIALLGFSVRYFGRITGFGKWVPVSYTIRFVIGLLIIATPILNLAVLSDLKRLSKADSGPESN